MECAVLEAEEIRVDATDASKTLTLICGMLSRRIRKRKDREILFFLIAHQLKSSPNFSIGLPLRRLNASSD
jgi:hypothetical protein